MRSEGIQGDRIRKMYRTVQKLEVIPPAPLTWVSVHVQVLGTSEGESEAGRNSPGGPLARDHLRRLFPESSRVSIEDVDQSLPVLPSKRTANSHVWQRARSSRGVLDFSLIYFFFKYTFNRMS